MATERIKNRAFTGLQFTNVKVIGKRTRLQDMLMRLSLAFDQLPWRATFRKGESVKQALDGRNPKDIVQVEGFVPQECLSWPSIRKCVCWAFAGARLLSFEVPAGVKELGYAAFLPSLIEAMILPEGIVAIGEGCFVDCQSLREISLRATL
jgi:hypothetical protein